MLAKIGFLAILALGVGLGWGWDRHPAWGFHTPPVPFVGWRFGFDLPPSLEAQRAQAVAALIPEHAATLACKGALGAQSASLKAVAAVDAGKLAEATHAVVAARAVAESFRQSSVSLKAYRPAGVDACAAWSDADRAVVGVFK
jgi:hypothetical protein